jgi:glycosyltransferase involved in cell wall biosynthesis
MAEPVDLLLITWDRRQYVEKTLAKLLADPADYRLHCWDNGSTDGTADLIAGLDDPRVVARHFSKENLNQREPCFWFFDHAKSDVVGKVDDDILMEPGWIERLAPLVRREPRFGMLCVWAFMPEDWDEELARPNILEVSGTRVFRTVVPGGRSFVARLELMKQYASERVPGLPVDRIQMSQDGLIQGYPLPILMGHNMDDPRSPHCVMTSGELQEHSAFTARRLGFASAEDYAAWIAKDAYIQLTVPCQRRLWWHKLQRSRTLKGRILRRLIGRFDPLRF